LKLLDKVYKNMEHTPKNEILKESIFEPATEINLFCRWLFKDNQKFHRDLIYKFFPELTDIHTNPDNLSEVELYNKVENVISAFRQRYSKEIALAETNILNDLPSIEPGIKALEDLMNETEHFNYLVMPTVYPICPFDFNRNLFYFSITKVSEDETKFPYLPTLAFHEISHFIFFRQIAKIPNKLSDRGIHHLKEVLTPVILQHSDIIKHRRLDNIAGNKESTDYNVEVNGEVMSIFNYVNQEYLKNPTSEGYLRFLNWLIKLFEEIEPEVLVRDELFAKHGRSIMSIPEIKEQFLKPIKI
jgi:hypothetical protein